MLAKLAKGLALVVLMFIFLFLGKGAFAEGEFSTNYDINYDFGSDGIATVTEKVTFKNKTDQYYVSSYNLSYSGIKLENIEAFDSKGGLQVNTTSDGAKSGVEVRFRDQVVGQDKEYSWTLRYRSKDLSQAQGKTWQISIPRAPNLKVGDGFNLSLAVPLAFGDPTSIAPEPMKTVERGGKIIFEYSYTQLKDSGILANFGSEQVFEFDIIYSLDNRNALPAMAKVPLPPNTNYQQTILSSIDPKPENVTFDDDGNYLAWFRIPKREKVSVHVKGLAKLYLNPWDKRVAKLGAGDIAKLTAAAPYWEVNDPRLKSILAEVFKGKTAKSNGEKAKLIDRYVANKLSYAHQRVEEQNFERLGAVGAAAQADLALCGEYTDLFVALARSAGIPARRLEGYAYTSNTDLRPLSLNESLLHAWPEYYDENKGWVMIDPTWESSNEGVDYFSKFDLNHIVFAVLGTSSTEPSFGAKVDVKFSDAKFVPMAISVLRMDAPKTFIAGFPAAISLRVENIGNYLFAGGEVSLKSDSSVLVDDQLVVGPVPPFGWLDFGLKLNSNKFFDQVDSGVYATLGEASGSARISILPVFSYRPVLILIISLLSLMGLVYILAFVIYFVMHRRKGKK